MYLTLRSFNGTDPNFPFQNEQSSGTICTENPSPFVRTPATATIYSTLKNTNPIILTIPQFGTAAGLTCSVIDLGTADILILQCPPTRL